jgi:hypothetical protein
MIATSGINIIKNCVIKSINTSWSVSTDGSGVKSDVVNCTLLGGLYGSTGSTLTSQNNYIKAATSNNCYSGTTTKGANDATSTTEAITANLRSIAYSTANFINVTPGSENLRPVVSFTNKLLDNGANLTSSGVTTDIVGTARPQNGAFDIGGFENDIPLCWNYTARYKGTNKLFKLSGPGAFPKNLNIPSNVDKSTGKMVDDGVFIDPSKYTVR